MTVKILVAVDSDNSIDLLWNCPEDMKRVAEARKGNVLIYGSKTFESMNRRILKGSLSIVVSRDLSKYKDIKNQFIRFVKSSEKALAFANSQYVRSLKFLNDVRTYSDENGTNYKKPLNIIIFGGLSIYNHFLDKCDEIDITHVYGRFDSKANLLFPDIPKEFSLRSSEYLYRDIPEYNTSHHDSKKLRTTETSDDSVVQVNDKNFVYRSKGNYVRIGTNKIIVAKRSLYTRENIEEQKLLDLYSEIMGFGQYVPNDRTLVGTYALFDRTLTFDLSNNTVPVLTTKKMPMKTVIKELLWFLSGSTDTKELEAQGVKIWSGNSTREFLDNRGLQHLPIGSIGKGYGYQWRRSGEVVIDGRIVKKGVDQIAAVIDLIKNNPSSRRILVNAWSPGDLDEMALPPCHYGMEFYVDYEPYIDSDKNQLKKKVLHMRMMQRSCDMFLGVPFNIMSYAVLLHMICKVTGCLPGKLHMKLGNAHIYTYQDHLDGVRKQVLRSPYSFPKIEINADETTDINSIKLEDIKIIGYKSHSKLTGKMAI